LTQNQLGDFAKLPVWGQNGMIQFMILLGWWGLAINDRDELGHQTWMDVLADLTWVLETSAN
jgi:hypothetical protein